MKTRVQIGITNPSSSERRGVVVMPWAAVQKASRLDPGDVQVFQGDDPLPTQVDRIDSTDPGRDELVFVLRHPIGPRKSDTNISGIVTAGKVKKASEESPHDPDAVELPTGVKLKTRDDSFKIWINTAVDHHGHGTWFGGAVTDVETGPIDLLDACAYYKEQEPRVNKRVQVDRVRLFRSALDEHQPWADEYVFDKPWTTVAASPGPVRAIATIRSTPFPFKTVETGKPEQAIECAMYHTFWIYSGDHRLHESMCVRQVYKDEKPSPADWKPGQYLWFSPRYFMLMRLALAEPIRSFRYPSHSGWFSLASSLYPYSAYAFSTNAHAGPVWNPPLDYEDDDDDSEDDAFMWELSATREARAIHTFGLKTNERLHADRAGAAWYDHAYHPLEGFAIT